MSTVFDEQAYLQNKLSQLNSDPVAKQQAAALGWTGGSVDDLRNFMAKAGITPQQHYESYGKSEGISPYNTSNTSPAGGLLQSATGSQSSNSQWEKDYYGFFDQPEGFIADLVNGAKVTKMGDGSAVYQDGSGAWFQFTKDDNPVHVARNAPGLRMNWDVNYRAPSYDPKGEIASRTDPAAFGFYFDENGYVVQKRSPAAGGDYKITTRSLNDIRDPVVRRYYEANPDEFYALLAIGESNFGSAHFGGTGYTYRNVPLEVAYQYFAGSSYGGDPSKKAWQGTLSYLTNDVPPGMQGPGSRPPTIYPGSGTASAPSASGTNYAPIAIGGGVAAGGSGLSAGGSGASGSSGLSSSIGYGGSITTPNQPLPNTALIEGRLSTLLATDQHGNYTNPLVRQASERAMQAFAGRGLLNSSMAIQAAQEAAIAKAIDIAGPDAQRVFDNLRGDKDWAYRFEQDRLNNAAEIEKARILANLDLDKLRAEYGYRADADAVANAFNLRQNYVNSIANITNNYQQMVNNINQSGMRPEDKQGALADAAATRDAEVAYVNDLYSKMPGWQQAWLSPAVPTQGVDINTITNVSTLRNIIADPAQPQAVRNAAQARLNQLLQQQTAQQQTAQQPSGGLLNTTPEPNYA